MQEQQASEAKMQTGISVLGTIAGALFGRKAMSMGTLGKATTAARGMGRTMRESGDVGRASETLETYKAQLQELEHDIEAEIAGLEAGAAPPTRAFTAIEVRPEEDPRRPRARRPDLAPVAIGVLGASSERPRSTLRATRSFCTAIGATPEVSKLGRPWHVGPCGPLFWRQNGGTLERRHGDPQRQEPA